MHSSMRIAFKPKWPKRRILNGRSSRTPPTSNTLSASLHEVRRDCFSEEVGAPVPSVHLVLVRDVLASRREVGERASEAMFRGDTGRAGSLHDARAECTAAFGCVRHL